MNVCVRLCVGGADQDGGADGGCWHWRCKKKTLRDCLLSWVAILKFMCIQGWPCTCLSTHTHTHKHTHIYTHTVVVVRNYSRKWSYWIAKGSGGRTKF